VKSGVIEPDALTGMILGAEGIPDVAVLLNGPTGCKFYHGHVAHVQRGGSEVPDPYLTLEPWFFGQPRVPCTYLDDEDYIFGAGQKLHEILPSLAARWDGLILVVNAPGAALIGDDLEKAIALAGVQDRCIPVETPGFSCPGPAGTDRVIARVLRHIAPAKEKTRPGTVNLLGLSLMQRHWKGSLAEVTRLLARMGVQVLSSPGAGSETGSIRSSPGAAYNLLVFPEFGEETARWYGQNAGTPCYIPAEGAPIGFDATSAWVREVSELLGADPSDITGEIAAARANAAAHIAGQNSISGVPRGAGYAIRAESSVALPLAKWLYTYLGMVPTGVEVAGGAYPPYRGELLRFLEEIGASETWSVFPGVRNPDIVFADGMTGKMLANQGICRGYVEVGYPSSGRIELVPRTILGVSGALYLVEEILNILR